MFRLLGCRVAVHELIIYVEALSLESALLLATRGSPTVSNSVGDPMCKICL